MPNRLFRITEGEWNGKLLSPSGSGYDEEGNFCYIGTIRKDELTLETVKIPLIHLEVYAEWEGEE